MEQVAQPRWSNAQVRSADAASVTVGWVRRPERFAAMREEWTALLERTESSIFNCWEWLHPWSRRLGGAAALRILTARDDHGELLGVLPLMCETQRVGLLEVRRWCFLGEAHVGSEYLDVIAAPRHREAVTRAFARELVASRSQWDLLDLNDLDERSVTPGILRDELPAEGFLLRLAERCRCPNDSFRPGESFDAFLCRTRRRDNFLRRRKWLAKQPGYRVEVASSPTGLERPLGEFFRLHAMRWAGDGGSAGITGPEVEAFHRDATRLLAERGNLRLYTMWLGERAIASVYGIVHRDTFLYYQSGMDPEFRSRSAGMVLVGATFEDALASGLRHYDFLRGTEAYKADWVSQVRRTVGLRVTSRSGPGAWAVRSEDAVERAKTAVREGLPSALLSRIRQARRWLRASRRPRSADGC